MRGLLFGCLLLFVAVVTIGSPSFAQVSPADDNSHWDPAFRYMGFDYNGVSDFCFTHDGIVAFGSSRSAGGYCSPGIAYYDGSAWHAMNDASGLYAEVNTAASYGDILFAGGRFSTLLQTSLQNIGVWDWKSRSWRDVSGGVRGTKDKGYVAVTSMAIDGDNLFVGGRFDSAGNIPVNNIACYNITHHQWSTLGSGIMGGNAQVNCLVIDSNYLYGGGRFIAAGGVPATGIARWNLKDHTWDVLGLDGLTEDPSNEIYSIIPWRGSIVIGGDFSSLQGFPISNIARFDGKWNAMGSLSAPPSCFAVYNGELLETGAEGGIDSYWGDYTRWTGSDWEGLHWEDGDVGPQPSVAAIPGALHVFNGDLYATGGFFIDSSYNHHLARFHPTDSTWTPLDDIQDFGPASMPDHLVMVHGTLYASGTHGNFFQGMANTVEALHGNTWKTITSDSNFTTEGDLIFSDSTSLYRVISFEGDSTFWVPYAFERLDTSRNTWVRLDTIKMKIKEYPQCTNCGDVSAVLVANGYLYLAGRFDTINGIPANGVAKFNLEDHSWKPMSRGILRGQYAWGIHSFALFQDQLFAGGSFDTTIPNILRYNIQQDAWEPFGDTIMRGSVSVLSAATTKLYAAGEFTEIGGKPINSLAAWDGNAWNAVGDFPRWSSVYSLALQHDSDLIVGGSFATIGTITANNIARWNGHEWHPLGSGTNDQVNTIAVNDHNVYVGGWFTVAGNVGANGFADWNSEIQQKTLPQSPFSSFVYPNPASDQATVEVRAATSGHLLISLFNTAGMKIANFVDDDMKSGDQYFVIDLSYLNISNGAYYFQVTLDNATSSNPISIIR